MPDDFASRLDRAFAEGKSLIITPDEVCALSLALMRMADLEKFGYARDWDSIEAYCPLSPEGEPIR
jgi:hypothetical protein